MIINQIHHSTEYPPSITKFCPVIHFESSDNKKRIAGAKNVKAGDEHKFSDGWIEVGFPDGTYEIHSTKEPAARKTILEHFGDMY